jgi:hypothetical protein
MLQLDTRVCESCGLVQEQDGRYCRNCGQSLPTWAQSSALNTRRSSFLSELFSGQYRLWWGRLGSVVAVLLVIGFAWWFISVAVDAEHLAAIAKQKHDAEVEREAEAAAAAAALAREKKLTAVLTGLQAKFPVAWVGRYPGDGGYVLVNKPLSLCLVRSLTFGLAGDKDNLWVNVGMIGIRRESQAPVVNVTLFDEDGNTLARKAIVKFLDSDLDYGETRQVKDTMDYPKAGQSAFVAVDENGLAGTGSPAASSSDGDSSASVVPSAIPSPPPSDGYGSGENYRQSMMGMKAVLETQGYTVYWPHMGNPDTIGVTVQESTDGLKTLDDKKTVAKTIADYFDDVRTRHNKSSPGTTIVQFEPSGTRMTLSPK